MEIKMIYSRLYIYHFITLLQNVLLNVEIVDVHTSENMTWITIWKKNVE